MTDKIGQSIRMPGTTCPVCARRLSGATGYDNADDDAVPVPGDVTVCAYCRSFLMFTATLDVRLLTLEEIAELDAHTRHAMIELREQLRTIE